jgi:dolichol-phosphate mannosyltransferase
MSTSTLGSHRADAPASRAPALPLAEPSAAPDRSLWSFWQPRHWPAWCFVMWLRLSAALPLSWSLAVHRLYGRAMYSLARRQRQVARRNLELCFPRLTPAERERLLARHFESACMSIAEIAFAWFAADRRVDERFTVRGLEHVAEALAQGNGAILYTGHFTALEICGRPLRLDLPRFTVMYSRRSNALLDEIQRRGRQRVAHEAIPSDNVRALLRALKRNAAVWYAPDQMHSHGALVPFFGEPAMTSVATTKLARLSGAPIVPFSYRRSDERGRYDLEFHAPLRDLPTADALADTHALVRRLEAFIRAAPEQYQWLHRRFKNRPAGFPNPYRIEPPAEPPPPSTLAAAHALAGAKLSVVVPLNNESANVRPLLEELAAVLGGLDYEVIAVDDGSTDDTLTELRRVATKLGRVRVLRHDTRRGQSTALYNGIRAASSEVVATLDGDLQNDPRDVIAMLERYRADPGREDIGLIIGHRTQRRDSRIRRWSSRFANAVRARVLHDATPDTGCGTKLLRRSVFLSLPYFDHMHRFLPALMQRAGYAVVSMPVRHRARVHAKAHYGTWDRAFVGLVDLIGVAWLIRRNRRMQYKEEAL